MTEPPPPIKAAPGVRATAQDARAIADAAIAALRERGGVFVDAVRKTRMPMVVTDPKQRGNPIVYANKAFLDLSGFALDEVLGREPHFMNGPQTDRDDAQRFSDALAKGEEVVVETIQYDKQGRERCVSVYLTPIYDQDGALEWHFMSYLDVTARFDAERLARAQSEELAERYQQQDRMLSETNLKVSLILESARNYAIFTTDPDGRIDMWPQGAETVFGWTADEACGADFAMTFLPEDRESGAPERELGEARQHGRASDVRWHLRKDGERAFIEGTTAALRSDGDVVGFLKIGQDVTERHRAEERRKLLLAELQHRVRNTLAVVRSMTRRTAQNSGSVEQMTAHLEGRIDAFARVQAMVTRRPEGGVDLAAVIEDELLVHATREGDRLSIKGPEVRLRPKPAETLSLAIHELATNAVKYGALAGDSGRIEIRWTIDRGRLELHWREVVPGLEAGEPSREGFGIELLRRVLPYELGAETELCFAKGGLRFSVSLPVDRNLHEVRDRDFQVQTDR